MRYTVVSGPRHGALSHLKPDAGTVVYTPNRRFHGKDTFAYEGSASGQTSHPRAVTVNVPPPPRLGATMSWAFVPAGRYDTVASMIVNDVLIGARILITCDGTGCRHKSQTVKAAATKKPTCRKRRHCPAPKKPRTRTLDLTSRFRGWRLADGSRLRVSIVKTGYVGKVYSFLIRGLQEPSVAISCLAPGSRTPGAGC